MSSKFSSKTSTTSHSECTAIAFKPSNGSSKETVHLASGDHTLCGKRIGSGNGFWRERKMDSWDHNLHCQRCLKHTEEYQESLRLFDGPWKMPATLMLLAMLINPTPAQAGGPDPAEPRAPAGGDCYRAYAYPVNWQQARVVNQKGWQEMPHNDKLRISKLVADKKADWLLVPDHRLCGPVLGEMRLYATWFWRLKP